MAGIFLSHSTVDKSFVTRLAIDLVNRGFPVWFDTWELETGDSLIDRIYSGIDESTLLIVVISSHSVTSKWVSKELNAALAKEDQLSRRLILPIKISECALPLKLADRLYADFSVSYMNALEKLSAQLKKQNADKIQVPFEKQIIPLVFNAGIYLDELSLQKRIESLRFQLQENSIAFDQVVIAPDNDYEALKSFLVSGLDKQIGQTGYDHKQYQMLQTIYDNVLKLETFLIEGTRLIVDGMVKSHNWATCGMAMHWFARLIRTHILHQYSEAWRAGIHVGSIYGKEHWQMPLVSDESASEFFEVGKVRKFDIFDKNSSDNFSFFIDDTSHLARQFVEINLPDPVSEFYVASEFAKFVIPQMTERHLHDKNSLITFDFKGYMVGLH